MPLVVQKFGGTSVADAERIRSVADHVARTRRHGNDVVVVVSAMGKETDELLWLAGEVSSTLPRRELDMLITAGERKSMALLCMALSDLDCPAASFTGSQAGLITDGNHTRAKILTVRGERLREALAAGRVPVVAGAQGVSEEREITFLGRGGSDTTAVALAHALGAEACEIYTDVSGVFTADPRLVHSARRVGQITFEELLEMCAAGCPKPEIRSVEYARNHGVRLHVRSSFTWEPGTWVVSDEEAANHPEDPRMERPMVTAIAHDTSEAKLTVTRVPDRPGIAARLLRSLADEHVNVDMIVQNVSLQGTTDISFTVPKADLAVALATAKDHAAELEAAEVLADSEIATVSLIGAGMKTHPGVTATMFGTLAAEGINIEMISTSPIRISCVVRSAVVERAVQSLHTAFGLS
ncbi:MAG: aspartate kinase [Actinomycetota bacterium]|nr:aspartate kinase [Actinomycetota bacterium]PLS74914.1 MAG: aspartate kinase [Actinomycetota bacterium]